MVSSSAVVVWKRLEIVSRAVGVPGSRSSCDALVFDLLLKGSGAGQRVLGWRASGLIVDEYSPR
jgi:hypothetical protein